MINGGDIRVVDGVFGNAAAIGSGVAETGSILRGGDITINGGNITAVGGDGAAIGCGADMGGLSDGGRITFNGGKVNASISGDTCYAAAIGGGNSTAGGTIIFNGGDVVAFVPQLVGSDGVPDPDPADWRHPVGHGGGGTGENIVVNSGVYTESGAYGDDQTGRYSGAWTPPNVTLPDQIGRAHV